MGEQSVIAKYGEVDGVGSQHGFEQSRCDVMAEPLCNAASYRLRLAQMETFGWWWGVREGASESVRAERCTRARCLSNTKGVASQKVEEHLRSLQGAPSTLSQSLVRFRKPNLLSTIRRDEDNLEILAVGNLELAARTAACARQKVRKSEPSYRVVVRISVCMCGGKSSKSQSRL